MAGCWQVLLTLSALLALLGRPGWWRHLYLAPCVAWTRYPPSLSFGFSTVNWAPGSIERGCSARTLLWPGHPPQLCLHWFCKLGPHTRLGLESPVAENVENHPPPCKLSFLGGAVLFGGPPASRNCAPAQDSSTRSSWDWGSRGGGTRRGGFPSLSLTQMSPCIESSRSHMLSWAGIPSQSQAALRTCAIFPHPWLAL